MFDIAFSVTNKGRKTASASTVQVFDGSVKIAEMALEALASGSSVRKVLTVQPGGLTAGVHDLRFVVDSENAVEEINETNNTRQEELTVSVAENLPEIPAQISYTLSGEDLVLSWNAASSLGQNGGYQLMLTTADGEQTAPVVVSGNSYSISEPDRYRSWQIRSFSSAQLYSDWSVCHEYHVYSGSNSSGSAFTFEADGEFESLAYSFDDFEHELCLINKYSSAVGCDTYGIPRGIVKLRSNVGYQWSSAEANWQVCWDKEAVVISIGGPTEVPRKFISQTNGKDDIFWANSNGVWEAGFAARHSGELNGWTGTGEEVLLAGKNKILDIFEGSSDIGTLVLTDDPNGDALFLEDIYSALGSQARLRQINWIQAGGGDDVIDLTSQLYDLSGSRMKIYGGNGNDTIWANAGNHILYGDAGDDYLAGGSGNDLIIGGSGNDTLHGGGGEDLFTFGPDWGNDVVTQTADGCVKIWIDDGSIDHWDAVDLIYRDGSNSVKIIGCAAEKISFEFGDEGGRRHYDTYANQGAFRSSCSELNIVPFAKSPY